MGSSPTARAKNKNNKMNNLHDIPALSVGIGFALSGLIGYLFRKQIQAIATYTKECYSELINKVTWPTWKSLQESSVLVFVASLLIAGVVFAMDWTFGVNPSDSIWKGFVGIIYDLF